MRMVIALIVGMVAAATPLFPLLAQEDRQVNQYEQLGVLVADQCPADFRNARLEGELDTGWADLRLTCSASNGESIEARLHGVAMYQIHRTLDAIREEMAARSGNRWKTFVFNLTAARRFSFDVQY